MDLDKLILKFNEKLDKCREHMEKYNEVVNEENETLLTSVKEEITKTQQYIIEQTTFLATVESLKKFHDLIERLQNESFDRQKSYLIGYLEALKEALELAYFIQDKAKSTPEAEEPYVEYLNMFMKQSEDQIIIMEMQILEKQSAKQRRSPLLKKSGNLMLRVDMLLEIYKKGTLFTIDPGIQPETSKERPVEEMSSVSSTRPERTRIQRPLQRPTQRPTQQPTQRTRPPAPPPPD